MIDDTTEQENGQEQSVSEGALPSFDERVAAVLEKAEKHEYDKDEEEVQEAPVQEAPIKDLDAKILERESRLEAQRQYELQQLQERKVRAEQKRIQAQLKAVQEENQKLSLTSAKLSKVKEDPTLLLELAEEMGVGPDVLIEKVRQKLEDPYAHMVKNLKTEVSQEVEALKSKLAELEMKEIRAQQEREEAAAVEEIQSEFLQVAAENQLTGTMAADPEKRGVLLALAEKVAAQIVEEKGAGTVQELAWRCEQILARAVKTADIFKPKQQPQRKQAAQVKTISAAVQQESSGPADLASMSFDERVEFLSKKYGSY